MHSLSLKKVNKNKFLGVQAFWTNSSHLPPLILTSNYVVHLEIWLLQSPPFMTLFVSLFVLSLHIITILRPLCRGFEIVDWWKIAFDLFIQNSFHPKLQLAVVPKMLKLSNRIPSILNFFINSFLEFKWSYSIIFKLSCFTISHIRRFSLRQSSANVFRAFRARTVCKENI